MQIVSSFTYTTTVLATVRIDEIVDLRKARVFRSDHRYWQLSLRTLSGLHDLADT